LKIHIDAYGLGTFEVFYLKEHYVETSEWNMYVGC